MNIVDQLVQQVQDLRRQVDALKRSEIPIAAFTAANGSIIRRSLQDRASDTLSILDVIPKVEHEAIREHQSDYNDIDADFNEAIEHLSNRGGRLAVPQGKYPLKKGLIQARNFVQIEGQGMGVSIISQDDANATQGIISSFVAGQSQTPIDRPDDDQFLLGFGLRNLTVQGSSTHRYKMPIRLWLALGCHLENVETVGGTHGGIVFEHYAEQNALRGVRVRGPKTNPVVGGGGAGVWWFRGSCYNTMHDTLIEDVDGTGLSFDSGTEDRKGAATIGNQAVGLRILRTGRGYLGENGYALSIDGAQDHLICDFYFEDIHQADVPHSTFAVLIARDQSGIESNNNRLLHGKMNRIAGSGVYIAGSSDNTLRDIDITDMGMSPASGVGTPSYAAIRVGSLADVSAEAPSSSYPGGLPGYGNSDASDNTCFDWRIRFTPEHAANAARYAFFMLVTSDITGAGVAHRNIADQIQPGDPAVALVAASGPNSPRTGDNGNYVRVLGPTISAGTLLPNTTRRIEGEVTETNPGGQRVGVAGITVITTTANDSLSQSIGVYGDAAARPDSGTVFSSATGVIGGLFAGRNQGMGTVDMASAIRTILAATSGGHITTGITEYTAPPLVTSSTIGTITGKRIANQGGPGRGNTVGLHVDTQSGSSGTHHGLYVDGNDNYIGGQLGIGISTPAAKEHVRLLNATTTADEVVSIISRDRSDAGIPAPGYGLSEAYRLRSSTTAERDAARLVISWAVATDASRKAIFKLIAFDTAAREVLRGEASGSAPMIGFLGANATVREAVAANATDLATAIALVNDIKAKLITKGLIS